MTDETWLAERRLLGSCRCGFAPGAEHCPICDGIMGRFGQRLREQGKTLAEIQAAERLVIEADMSHAVALGRPTDPATLADMFCRMAEYAEARGRIDVDAAKAIAALAAPAPGVDGAPLPGKAQRLPNRHERRRSRSRRWQATRSA